ncbi:hypothetical protein A2U01_0083511, partial [Trifolium medium]|nr:hypothetical protein [Trifolium medium]
MGGSRTTRQHNDVQRSPFLQTRHTLPVWDSTSRGHGQWNAIHG